METYKLEKTKWDNADFEAMSWHDCRIFAWAFIPEESEIRLDLDYIFKWENPAEGEKYFSFWISPSTMVFENAFNISINLSLASYSELEIFKIRRSLIGRSQNGKFDNWLFTIECNNGEISVEATGYTMYVRQEPKWSQGQTLALSERGNINFEKL